MIDALRVWMGSFDRIAALVDAQAPRAAVPAPADDTYSLVFRTAAGAQGIIQQSAASWGPRLDVLRLGCRDATVWVDEAGTLWRAARDGGAEEVAIPAELRLPAVSIPAGAGPFAGRELPAFVRMAERFADLIQGAPPSEPRPASFEDGLAVQAVMDAARASSRLGTWARPEPPGS